VQRQVRHGQRSEDGADIRAAIEDAGSQRAFALREPIRDGADGGREVRGLAQAEGEARDAEAHRTARQRVPHGGHAPQGHGYGIAQARAGPVDQAAGERHRQRIGQLKSEDDPAIVGFAPAELFCERGLQQAQHLPIDVVDGGGEEQQAADVPAQPGCGLGCEEAGHFHEAAYPL